MRLNRLLLAGAAGILLGLGERGSAEFSSQGSCRLFLGKPGEEKAVGGDVFPIGDWLAPDGTAMAGEKLFELTAIGRCCHRYI